MPKFSSHINTVSEALSIRYNNLVYELQSAGNDIIVLSLGEAFFDLPLYSFDSTPLPSIYHYSHSRGLPELRTLLADYYAGEYGVPVDAKSEIIVTSGSKIAIYMSLLAIIDPGDEVVIHEPAWVSYADQIRLCHGIPVPVPYDVPITEIGRFITSRTKAVVLNYPNNPRGLIMSRQNWDDLHAMARQNDLFLLCDEAYSDFVEEGEEFVSCGVGDPDKSHSIICNSMSKNLGISGWRIGYVISNAELVSEILKINQHLVTCPATVLSYYLVDHFHDLLQVTKPQIKDVLAARRNVVNYLDQLGLDYLPGTATFYLFVSLGGSSLGSMEFCDRLLQERHVSAVPGIGYGLSCDNFIRISVGTEPMERIKQGLDAISQLVRETGPG